MVFDKELPILYGFFNLKLSKRHNPSRKKLQCVSKPFFLNFCLIFIEADINWYKTVKFYVLNESRSILLDPLKYTIEN